MTMKHSTIYNTVSLKTISQAIGIAMVTSSSLLTFAQDLTTENVVVITANQIEQNINDTLTDVEVIDRQDIERIQPQTFADLLANIAGIDVVQKGGQGQNTSIFSRGANSNQLLILIDGVRVGSATLGGKSVADISISQIERVEIIKGPRAALWGSDAIGGVIHIFTRRFKSNEHRIGLTTGTHGTREIDASIGFGNDNFSNTVTYSMKETSGIDAHLNGDTDNDGYENDSLSIRGDYNVTANSTIDWVAQRDQGETEFDTSFGGDKSSHDNSLWNLRYSLESADWSNQFSVSQSTDENLTFGNGVSKSDASVFETQRQQFNYLSHYKLSDSISLAGGLEWLEDDVSSSTTTYAKEKRSTKSVHLNGTYKNDSWLAEAAIRRDDVEDVASQTTFNLGLGYRINEQYQLSLNFGEGFKAPSFNDLYFPYGGNPDLKFETSSNSEFVIKGFYDIGNLVVSIYDSEIDNLIQWIPDTNGIWAPQNIGTADIFGIDASFKISHGNLSHKIIASYVEAEDGITGNQLPLRAKNHFGYEISYQGEAFDIFAQVQQVGERPDTDFETYMPTMLDAYIQLNVGLGYRFNENLQLKLKISDAMDQEPTPASGYNSEGRTYYLTLVHQNLF
ncbi:MAG: vitamin B12 transporter [Enterobacterales bacterium]|jgi:vitamin B12 transporter